MTKNLGEIIKTERKAKALSQSELGLQAFSGMNSASAQAKIKRIESGRQSPRVSELYSLAAALNIDIESLLLIDGVKKMDNKDDGFTVSEKVLDLFPKLRHVLRMLNDAVEIDDDNLINEIAARISHVVSGEKRLPEQLRA